MAPDRVLMITSHSSHSWQWRSTALYASALLKLTSGNIDKIAHYPVLSYLIWNDDHGDECQDVQKIITNENILWASTHSSFYSIFSWQFKLDLQKLVVSSNYHWNIFYCFVIVPQQYSVFNFAHLILQDQENCLWKSVINRTDTHPPPHKACIILQGFPGPHWAHWSIIFGNASMTLMTPFGESSWCVTSDTSKHFAVLSLNASLAVIPLSIILLLSSVAKEQA